ncbi:hypothetical protein GCM10019071_13590 [Sphingobium fuliginis]|uniref:Uncharacterized protein n=1 Tax=Sphingobium fuliginis (strain ATCC 27551) TaxID=336203 RepID=A0ABQ1ESN5_SPHSA|nr:hypothetical protein GCM10019071_13590 [Sphingobium fuliginis]
MWWRGSCINNLPSRKREGPGVGSERNEHPDGRPLVIALRSDAYSFTETPIAD